MNFYATPDSHIRGRVKVILDLSNYATNKELDHATDINTSDLAAKKDYIAKLVNIPTSLNDLKTKHV